ncbi:MAG: DUF971 domain-containing protein [Paraburkholderia sp.]|uniref:gamma-butyrobetaine hydroxylase-like domain-containing protein n=1 Tax=Paraburkholderia sp. TaxID=1926495 RepID=UPI0011F623B4|nr:gamma-butyrobetaine hydroxylase-like domain-containing protein [Paraburkholderia sp.]TAL94159.1 MAG: DUF971 domain-containing protein [Paraburkholderia sp.]
MKVPVRVELDSLTHTMTLHWPDAVTQRLSHGALRSACPCAACRRVRIAGDEVRAAEGVAVVDIQSMAYGVQLVFSDGHAQGIFPWAFLEALGSDAV